MSLTDTHHIIVNGEEALNCYRNNNIIDVLPLNKDKELISYLNKNNENDKNNNTLNISIPI